MPKSEIRKDYIQDKYVIIAPKRNARPRDVVDMPTATSAPASCVFCPGNIHNAGKRLATVHTAKKKGEPWAIAVIGNKFPSVSPAFPKAYGYQEVVVESADHKPEIEELSTERVAEIFATYAARTRAISKDKKIQYILIFKNNGGVAGASLQHSHSQIFATQFLPPHLLDKSQRIQEYKLANGSCVYCDVIKKERTGPRLVLEDKNVIAFCPYASFYNYEIWLMPKRHVDNITQLNPLERKSMAGSLKKILQKIERLGLPYNYYFHQVVNDEDQHLYMKITPRGSVWAGVEIGSGLIINPIAPEAAAKFYRS